MRLSHRLVLASAVFAATACSGNEPHSSIGTDPGNETKLILALSAEADTIPESTSKTLTARVTDLTGLVRPATVTWSSTNPGVASVANGVVTGVSIGTASIIASTTGAADTADIFVSENDIVLDVQPSAAAVAMGDTVNFTATARTRSGDVIPIGNFTWVASDTSTASFVGAGLLRTKKEGEIEVTAEALQRQATGTVRVFRSPVASVTMSPSTANVYKGATTTFVVTLRDQNGRLVEEDISWNSSDITKATVDEDGKVTGVGVGTVVISATADRKTGSATVYVMNPPASSLTLNVPSSTLAVGAEMQASVTASDAGGETLTGKTIAYQSGNPSVATVSNNGTVKGITEGSVTISAIVDGIVARQPINVRGGKATSLLISPASPIVNVGFESQLTAVVLDQNGVPMANQSVSWSSANTSVATISAAGVVKGISGGTSNITATSGSASATVSASVQTAPVASVRVSPTSLSMVANKQGIVTAEALDGSGSVLSGRVVSWSSANPAVATVTNSGVVTSLAAGSTTLTASIEGKTAGLPITVSSAPLAPVAAVSVSLANSSLNPSQQTQATATLTDASGNVLSGRSVTWSSMDTAVAKVSASGLVTTFAGGTVAIIASSEGKSGSASLTVSTPIGAPVYRINAEVPTQNLVVGQQVQTMVKLYDAAGNILTGRTITYTSDNSTVITVSATGVVKGVGSGNTKMRVSSGGVTVQEPLYVTGTAGPVSSIVVTPSSSALQVGQTAQASATAKDAQGATLSGQTFTWTTSNPSAAIVSGSGLITAVGAGSATISAAASGITGSMTATVTQASGPGSSVVSSVSVSFSPTSITIGGIVQATAVARNSTGGIISGKTATWSLGGSLLANISASGVITGLAAGLLPVTATIDGISGSASLQILAVLPPPPVGSSAELPRTTLNFSYPAKTGQTIYVAAGGNLQTALNNAQRGDEIVLAAGATFTGNFVLPPKTGTAANGWIVVRSEQLSQLPARGTRVKPSNAGQMPKLVTATVDAALKTQGATSGWWLAGLEITVSPSLTAQQYGLVSLGIGGSPQTSLSSVPSDLVLDRLYIHGQSNTQLSRCVGLHSARTQISDSWLDECHGKGFDSQAIWGGNGPGPYLIENNTLRGAGENIMFGGSDPAIPGLVPSDIEIKRNYIHTPLNWKGVWTKKNLLELKNAVRVVIEGNVLDGSWYDGQGGEAMVFKSTNQSGNCRWCRTTDVTVRRNLTINAGGGINVSWADAHAPVDTVLSRVYFTENVFENLASANYPGIARGIAIYGVKSFTIERTVITGALSSVMFFERVSTNCQFRDLVMVTGSYGVMGTGTGGQGALTTYCPTYNWSNVNLIGGGTGYPTGTSFISSESQSPLSTQIRSLVTQATAGVITR